MYQRILIATDGSALAKKAVDSGIALASLTGAEVIALKVCHRFPVSYFEGNISLTKKDIDRVEQQWGEESQAIVEVVKESALKQGVKARALTVRSNQVAAAIMAAGKKYKCDLIVMASHGRKGIQGILLGSETQHVLTHSTTPVLVLR
ncbi:MAG: universal stress protein [Burkholderiaceae bacterium]